MPSIHLAAFIHKARRATYAAQGDEASVQPLIFGSKQLEFQDGDLRYQDIYVGMFRFAGQEIVFQGNEPHWSMSYAGGVDSFLPIGEAKSGYVHLQSALLLTPKELPLRGPANYEAGNFKYICHTPGSLESFHAHEVICIGANLAYELHFAGGLLR